MLNDIITMVGQLLLGYETTDTTPVHVDGLVDWFADISSMLLANDFVRLFIAIALLLIVVRLVMSLINKVGKKKR